MHLHNALENLFGQVNQMAGAADAGVADQDVYPAEGLHHLSHQRRDLVVVGDVSDLGQRLRSDLSHLLRGLFGAGIVQIRDRDIGARMRVAQRDRSAQSACRACDYSHLALKFHFSFLLDSLNARPI